MIEPDIHRMKTDRAWNKLYNRLADDRLLDDSNHRKKRVLLLPRYGVVAVAAIVCLVFGISWYVSSYNENQLSDVITQENLGKSTLVTTLEDGSVVYLANAALLKYPTHFDADGRNVQLEGDAYFDIKKNKQSPFMIETKEINIKVLGTAFDVQADKKTSAFSLSVQRGSVSVTLKKSGKEVLVKAGEMVVLQDNQLKVTTHNDVAHCERYWKNMRFKDESLANILHVINLSSSGIKLQTTPALAERKLTVEFSDSSPEVVAELICLALNMKSSRQGNNLILSE